MYHVNGHMPSASPRKIGATMAIGPPVGSCSPGCEGERLRVVGGAEPRLPRWRDIRRGDAATE